MSSRCAAWSARVGKACRVVHATKAQQGLRRLLPTSSRTSCVDFILCLCNAAEQDTTGDGDQRRRQPRCDHGQSMWRSTSGPCRMVVSKKKKNKVKSNIQTEKKTMRCNKIIPKSLQSTCGSPPRRLDADSPARSDTKTTMAANSTSCGAKPRRKFGRLSDSRRYMYFISNDQRRPGFSAPVVFSHVSEIQRVCGPNDNPESVPPHLETRAWQKIKVLPLKDVSKKNRRIQGELVVCLSLFSRRKRVV